MEKKRAIVLGCGGFIGSHLATRLKKEEYWVRGVDLKYPEFSKTACDEFIIGDLRDPKVVEIIIPNDIDELYCLACDMGGAGYIFTGDNDANVMHNSAMINLNVANECVKKKVKKVFYSSSACVYPKHNQLEPNNPKCSEDSVYPANPDSEYGWEKLFSERLYLSYYRNYGLDVRICRYHNIFGPEGAWDNGKEKAPAAICRKVAEANNNSVIEIWGDGCLPAEEEIITENGLKKVCNINLFDKVLGKEGFQKVINTFKRNYKGKLYIINSKGLLPFKVTEEHPVKIMRLKKFCKAHSPHYCKPNCFCRKHTCSHDIVFKREWLKPSEINYKTDYLCVPKIKDIREIEIDLSKYVGGHHTGLPQEEPLLKKFVINEDWAWLLGLYVAEGWSTDKKVSWCLGRHEKKLRLCLHNKLDKLGIKWFESNKPSSPSSSETNIYRAPLAKWLKITFGDRATNKIIPKFIYELDKKEILYFIKGFCDGDGTHKSLYASKRFSISSSSKSLLVGLQILLSKVDNFGTILWKDNWYGKTSKSGKILSGGKVSYAENPMTVSWFQDENYIYVPVKSVEELDFDGFVYNFETEDNTYGLPACVHNCQTRSFLYIDECLEATLRFMRNDNNFLGPVNIGSEEMISINDFTKMIINISGKNLTIKNIPGPEGVRGRNSDNKLYKEKMNWVVSKPLRDGMEKLYKWIENQIIITGLNKIANKYDYVKI